MENVQHYLDIARTVTSWILLPLYWFGLALLIILQYMTAPLLSLLAFVLTPLAYTARLVGNVLFMPVRFLERFETIYIFLGIGSLLGVAVGCVLFVIFAMLVHILRLRPSPDVPGPTAREYREARERDKLDGPAVEAPSTDVSPVKPRVVPREPQMDRLAALLPTLTVQSPTPRGKGSLLDESFDDDVDWDS